MRHLIKAAARAALFAAATLFGAALFGGAGPATAQTAFAPVVVVNDDVITYYDVEQRARLLEIAGQAPGPQLNRAALEALIDDQLRLQAAERFQVSADAGAVEQNMGELGQRYGLDPDNLRSDLASRGIEFDSLRRLIEAQVLWRQLVSGRFRARATPSELELDSEIELAATGRSESFRLSELVVATGQGREQQARATLQRAINELRGGAPFAEVARRYSDAPSGRSGGDVGWVPETALPAPLAALIKSTGPGQVTEPFATPGGLSVYLVADTRQEAPPWARDAEVSLRQITVDGDDDEARAAAEAMRSGADGCGDIPDLSEGMTMDSIDRKLVRTLPTPIRGAIEILQAGQASRPVAIEGKTSVFVVCDRTGGVDPETRNQLRDQIMAGRMARLAEGFLQDLRREAVIERR
ncbi:MAG: peptidylprolyl isomerase [Pseudomonadota bacterium]